MSRAVIAERRFGEEQSAANCVLPVKSPHNTADYHHIRFHFLQETSKAENHDF
ncbi:hypothetical protein J6590_000052 [Homalodisca vitripennis]|nr:hypothetical protein J6590_000052 [Homalodisca vitripennis]